MVRRLSHGTDGTIWRGSIGCTKDVPRSYILVWVLVRPFWPIRFPLHQCLLHASLILWPACIKSTHYVVKVLLPGKNLPVIFEHLRINCTRNLVRISIRVFTQNFFNYHLLSFSFFGLQMLPMFSFAFLVRIANCSFWCLPIRAFVYFQDVLDMWFHQKLNLGQHGVLFRCLVLLWAFHVC